MNPQPRKVSVKIYSSFTPLIKYPASVLHMKLKYIFLAGLPMIAPITIQASEQKSSDSTPLKEQPQSQKVITAKLIALLNKYVTAQNKHRENWKAIAITTNHKLEQDLGIDSLDRLRLSCLIEKEFALPNFRLPRAPRPQIGKLSPNKTVQKIDTVQNIIDLITNISPPKPSKA